jgi:hypothetical protein
MSIVFPLFLVAIRIVLPSIVDLNILSSIIGIILFGGCGCGRQQRRKGEKMNSSSADVCFSERPILIGVSKIRRCRCCSCDEGVTTVFRFLMVDDNMVAVLPVVVVVMSRVVVLLVVLVIVVVLAVVVTMMTTAQQTTTRNARHYYYYY